MSRFVYCRGCAKEIHETAHTCPQCGAPQFAAAAPSAVYQAPGSDDAIVRQIADYERISGWIWIALGILQIISVVGVIAGVWNIFAGRSRLQVVPLILTRDHSVPALFDDIGGLVVIGILNVVLGGVIGVAFVAFDFVIRDKVLANRHLFTSSADEAFLETRPFGA